MNKGGGREMYERENVVKEETQEGVRKGGGLEEE